MSDEEQVHSEEEGESKTSTKRMAATEDTGPSEAELAMQRRREAQMEKSNMDDDAQEILEGLRSEIQSLDVELRERREKSERRKQERAEEEARIAQQRSEEDAKRKAEEEERKRKKEEEEDSKKVARAAKMAEFDKWKLPPKANFIITKKDDGGMEIDQGEGEEQVEKKSREQLEAEKSAILKQRLKPLDIAGFDSAKLSEKAKELHNLIVRLESEKYDLEKRFKAQQYDMMELAERARQMNKVGKGGLKRITLGMDESDVMQERFAGAPAKVVMYSLYERQKDKRDYGGRRELYTGPVYGYPADRINPSRKVVWGEDGLPLYEGGEEEGAAEEPAQEVAEE